MTACSELADRIVRSRYSDIGRNIRLSYYEYLKIIHSINASTPLVYNNEISTDPLADMTFYGIPFYSDGRGNVIGWMECEYCHSKESPVKSGDYLVCQKCGGVV